MPHFKYGYKPPVKKEEAGSPSLYQVEPYRHSLPAWKVVRREVLLESGYVCKACGCAGANEVDHVKPVFSSRDPLFLDKKNLQALCKKCHSRKTAREDGGFGNARKK